MLQLGLNVSINSDDPSYFGGYIGANYERVQTALELTDEELAGIARNSIEATFLPEDEKQGLLAKLNEYVAGSR